MDVFLGTVQAFGFNFAPRGWMTCQGQLLNISTNTALFSLLGTTFGGNGQQTFGLPNLQGRTVVGQGTSTFGSYAMGQVSGNAQVTLQQNQMPMHTHSATETGGSVNISIPAYDDSGNTATPGTNAVLGSPTSGELYYDQGAASTNLKPFTSPISGVNIQLGMAGGSQPVNIESPYLAMNYCICVQGIFPSRN